MAATKITHADFQAFLYRSNEVDRFVKKTAQKIIRNARIIFLSQVKHTHGVTIPPYADSFKLNRLRRGVWQVLNTDPAALWIEFGAHAGGKTKVLAYRPLGKAVDAVQGGAK